MGDTMKIERFMFDFHGRVHDGCGGARDTRGQCGDHRAGPAEAGDLEHG